MIVYKQVTVTVPYPAELVDDLLKADPEFLGRVLLYGLTRRSIYRHLTETRERET